MSRIRSDDVAAVRERTDVAALVAEHVTLRPAGVGAWKGLCPFHEERTPSFQVRPQIGYWHCFGCGESGDGIAFLQKIEALPFAEAVERLAERAGVPLRYEDGGAPNPSERVGHRHRLVEANRTAAAYYAEQLRSPEAEVGRRFLAERGLESGAAAFGVGFAPGAGEALTRQLRGRGFTDDEIVTAGLAGRGRTGLYDRFRGRLVWPIRGVTGEVVGFGARRLSDDDRIEAKYLNTPETPLYRKSQVLYGVDVAKREIARRRQVVVVEGYTDVMACHLAGVPTAVATCGTAFGSDHVSVVRRLLGDDSASGSEVVFTFDGDAAGRKAALKAFENDRRFVAQTYVAVDPHGRDPCELRQVAGDAAVVALVADRVPLYEFVVRSTLRGFDLDSDEGRLAALDAVAPVVAGIRDDGLRQRYAVRLDRWLGFMDERFVVRRVARAAAAARRAQPPGGRGESDGAPGGPGGPGGAAGAGPAPEREVAAGAHPPLPAPDSRDPVARRERQALELALQQPDQVAADFDDLGDEAFSVPAYRVVFDAVRAAGGVCAAGGGGAGWVARVTEQAPGPVRGLVAQLAVGELHVHTEEARERVVRETFAGIRDVALTRQVAEAKRHLQRLDPGSPESGAVFARLLELEQQRRRLRQTADGE